MEQSTQSSGSTWMAHWSKKRNQEAINVDESKKSRIKHDIFDTSAKVLCSDSQVQLQNTKNAIKNLSFFGDGCYTTTPRTSSDEDHCHIVQSNNNKPVLASKEPHLQAYTGDHFDKMLNFSSPKHGPSSSKRSNGMFRSSFDEFETTRICTTFDSVIGLRGTHSKFCQTTHSMLITKQTDSNHTYLNSRKSTDFGKHKLNTVTPLFSGVKIRSLQHFMDTEPQQEGIYRLSKLANVEKNVENASEFEEHKDKKGKKIAHDSEHILDYEEQSTSRTQSLDKETVLLHAEHVNPLESVNDLSRSLNPESGGRWLKRLKLMNGTSSSHSITTNSSDHMEKSRNHHGKEVMVVDEAMTLKTHGPLLDIDSAKKDRVALLSQSWIKRWCHHEANPNKKVVDEPPPRGSKLEDMKKKSPSIAAMALMAKTMNCMESYDVHNRGAVMVWTTKS